MRYFKTTLVWLIVLSALGGYSYIDFEKTRLEEKAKDEATKLFPFSPIQVITIRIEKEDSFLELERWDDGWRIVAPVKAKADGKAVEKFLGYVTDSRNDADYVLDPDPTPEKLVEFGLDKPEVSVTFKTGKELTPYTLIFGDRAPTMGVAFAMVEGSKPVYRVLAYARAEADKDLYYFRDKTVLRLSPVMIDQLAINRPDGDIRIKLPQAGKWELEKPIKAMADHKKVFETLGMLANVEVKEFIAESGEDKKAYGLENPSIQILFWGTGDSEPTVTLNIGNRSPEKRGYYCSMSDRENIFILDGDTVRSIPTNANQLRSRELFALDQSKLKRIEVRSSGKETIIVKDVSKEWRENNVDGENVDFNTVNDFVNELTTIEVMDFVDDSPDNLKQYGLDSPSAQLLIWLEESAAPIHLSIGKETPAGFVYASSSLSVAIIALDLKARNLLESHF